MKTYFLAVAVVVVVVAGLLNATCVKQSMKSMERLNSALNVGR